MIYSPEQLSAAEAVTEWIDSGSGGVFRLFGYAGTGKTTIAKDIASHAGAVSFATYTGKAASVMRAKGCTPCTTIHGMIYKLKGESKDGPEFVYRGILAHRPSLIVIDECSMVDARIGEDLLRPRVPILVLGDPFQLPPIAGGGFFTSQEPNVMLEEIHRQAADSGVLRMATAVRRGERLSRGQYSESCVVPKNQMHDMVLADFDQVICGTHIMRNVLNKMARRQIGINPDDELQPGEKILVQRNNHIHGVMNGETATVVEVQHLPDSNGMMILTIDLGDDVIVTAEASGHSMNPKYKKPPMLGRHILDIDFGYAITCHKSQGSQWDNLLVIDDSRSFRDDASRWLYTAITRAAKMVTVAS